jgi:UDP-N-acetylglucosamine--N-acetylmuramyl-(pentapeptide) pyrophosphoryl-undecaprenol N-acetylglucosamine transferase
VTGASIVLTAGGTGGHLFPAHALAGELIRRGYELDLITDSRTTYLGEGFPGRAVHKVPSATFQGKSPLEAIKMVATNSNGFKMAYDIMGDLKPKAMIGFGGYPTIPPMLAALARGIPSLIQEQNSVMGRANRFLAPMVKAIALSFEDTKFLEGKLAEKAYVTGTPLREQVLELRGGVYQPAQPGQPLNLLIFGGSQGARFFSDIMPVALQLLPQDLRDRLMVVQQCRAEDIDRVFDSYEVAGVAAELATFFNDLPYRMAGAHLVVCRSGATTMAELSALGRPAVLVPLPNSVDNDQLENATRFEKAGAGWCFEQSIMTAERLAGTLRRLFEEPATLARAASRSKSLARFDSVARLADLVVTLAEAPETFSAPNREAEGHAG